jgi:hypothetical protein
MFEVRVRPEESGAERLEPRGELGWREFTAACRVEKLAAHSLADRVCAHWREAFVTLATCTRGSWRFERPARSRIFVTRRQS